MSQLPVEILSEEEVQRLIAHPDAADIFGLRDAAIFQCCTTLLRRLLRSLPSTSLISTGTTVFSDCGPTWGGPGRF